VARTVLLYAGPALLIAVGWLRLEEGRGARDTAFWIAVLALLPALVRPVWGRALAAVVVSLLAVRTAFDLWILDARPFDEHRDFFGPLLTAVKDGALRFYDVSVPFPSAQEPEMHGVMLLAIYVFCLATALGLAARRPVVAAAALVAGAAWPATLVSTGFARGVLILAGVLAILAWGGRRAPHSLQPAVVAGVVLALAAIGATSSEAVAKSEFLSWKRWDPYDRPDRPVGVRYVWDANYGGIRFPEKVTTVLTVEGPERAHYWRATTLDTFDGDRWIEDLRPTGSSSRVRELFDPLLPVQATDQRRWVRADVTIKALLDRRLPGPSVPVAYDPRGAGTLNYDAGGVATLPEGQSLRRDMRYTVWAYSPRPTPVQLAQAKPPQALRNTVQQRYLELGPGAAMMPFGSEAHDERLQNLLTNPFYVQFLGRYVPLYDRARQLTAGARTPYAAAVTIEAWFRSQGGFTYDEQPPVGLRDPALVAFVEEFKRGYCQHFAGAMTLMLRSLGVPARVAVGFTSGSYNASKRRWTVTDHDAHAWVEVWFDGWGWIPFDPTPGRGQLSGTYSTASPLLNREQFAQVGGPSAIVRQEARITRAEGTGLAGGRDVPGDLEAFGGTVRDTGGSLLRLLALLALAAIALVALAKLVVRRSRYLTRDPRRVSAACRAELVDYLADQGIRITRSATLADVGEAVSERLYVDADAFVAAAGAARFAQPGEAGAAARRARRELRALRGRLRRRLSVGERLRGFVSVRSLGLTG
jgi:transglutaminase-like putative cysteine protease